MRLFVAADPPPRVLEPLAATLPSLREQWPGLGWIPADRWHLTLCFLGTVDSDVVPGLERDLASVAASTPPIPAAVGPGGTFPGGRRPRVAWVGVTAGPELADLARRVGNAAAAAGVAVDRRPYRAHITLARARREPPPDADGLRAALSVGEGGAFAIAELVLYQSHLGPKPRYEVVGGWPLGG